jgi:hypothetical protein
MIFAVDEDFSNLVSAPLLQRSLETKQRQLALQLNVLHFMWAEVNKSPILVLQKMTFTRNLPAKVGQ